MISVADWCVLFVAVGLLAGRSQSFDKIAINLKIFVDVDHLK